MAAIWKGSLTFGLIDILDFVKEDEIDPRYFETPKPKKAKTA